MDPLPSPAVETVFKPVQPPTTFEETVERLGTGIRLGLLAPGSRLPAERALARQLRISRSTLRQALNTLVQSGHLVAIRGRSGGTFVAAAPPLSATTSVEPIGAEVRSVLDERVAVEVGSTMLAAERCERDDVARLHELVERMGSADSFEDYRRADMRFHVGIAEAARSPKLVASMAEVQGFMGDLIARIAHPEEVLTRSNEQHRRLVALLARGDARRAVELIRRHIEGTEHILAGLWP